MGLQKKKMGLNKCRKGHSKPRIFYGWPHFQTVKGAMYTRVVINYSLFAENGYTFEMFMPCFPFLCVLVI